MLRNDLATFCSSLRRRRRAASSLPHVARSSTASSVEGSANAEPSSTPKRAVGCVLREHAAQRRAARLAVHLDLEVARCRRERHAAAGPVRRAGRARAGAAGALLAPRLRAAAGDEPAALRRARAPAVRRSSPRARSRGRRAASARRRRPIPRASRPWPSCRPSRAGVLSARPSVARLPHFDEAVLRARARRP